jgi:hypothetical protein
MEMEVVDRLSRRRTVVDDDPAPRIRTETFARELPGYGEHPSQERLVLFRRGLKQRAVMFLGHHENMRRRYRANVGKRDDVLVLVEQRRACLPGRDIAKYAGLSHQLFPDAIDID